MSRCEDFPCCGHEPGCCPDFDEAGRQLNMKCTCGATVPLTSRYSICESCLNRPDPDDPDGWYDDDEGTDYDGDDEEPSDGMTDVEADADTLKSAGWGTDEDYGYFGDDNDQF